MAEQPENLEMRPPSAQPELNPSALYSPIYVPNMVPTQFGYTLHPSVTYGMPPPMYPGFYLPSSLAFSPIPIAYPPQIPPFLEKQSNSADLKAIENYIHSLLSNKREEQSKEETTQEEDKMNRFFEQVEKLNLSQTQIDQPSNGSPVVEVLSSTSTLETEQQLASSVSSNQETQDLPPAASEAITKRRGKNLKKSANLEIPKNLDRLTDCMVVLYQSLLPSPNEFAKRMKLLQKLQQIVDSIFPNANPRLNLFGSSANQFGFKNADMDICMMVGPEAGSVRQIVQKLGYMLPKKGMKHVRTLPRARVPIVKFEDPKTKFSCDICFNNELPLHNTKLIAEYAKIDERFRQLGFIVKYWAKQRKINEPYLGTLSSYAYLLMVINFLQQRKPPILPALQQIRDIGDEDLHVDVDGYDCYFFNKSERLKDFGMANSETVGELLAAFFKQYGTNQFDWENIVLSPRTGGFLTKTEKGWNKIYDEKTRDYFLFAIEDPFEITHNLGRVVDRENFKVIKYEFRRAYRLICNGEELKVLCKQYDENE